MNQAQWLSASFTLAVALTAAGASNGADEQEIKLSDCPAAVQKTLREKGGGAATTSTR